MEMRDKKQERAPKQTPHEQKQTPAKPLLLQAAQPQARTSDLSQILQRTHTPISSGTNKQVVSTAATASAASGCGIASADAPAAAFGCRAAALVAPSSSCKECQSLRDGGNFSDLLSGWLEECHKLSPEFLGRSADPNDESPVGHSINVEQFRHFWIEANSSAGSVLTSVLFLPTLVACVSKMCGGGDRKQSVALRLASDVDSKGTAAQAASPHLVATLMQCSPIQWQFHCAYYQLLQACAQAPHTAQFDTILSQQAPIIQEALENALKSLIKNCGDKFHKQVDAQIEKGRRVLKEAAAGASLAPTSVGRVVPHSCLYDGDDVSVVGAGSALVGGASVVVQPVSSFSPKKIKDLKKRYPTYKKLHEQYEKLKGVRAAWSKWMKTLTFAAFLKRQLSPEKQVEMNSRFADIKKKEESCLMLAALMAERKAEAKVRANSTLGPAERKRKHAEVEQLPSKRACNSLLTPPVRSSGALGVCANINSLPRARAIEPITKQRRLH